MPSKRCQFSLASCHWCVYVCSCQHKDVKNKIRKNISSFPIESSKCKICFDRSFLVASTIQTIGYVRSFNENSWLGLTWCNKRRSKSIAEKYDSTMWKNSRGIVLDDPLGRTLRRWFRFTHRLDKLVQNGKLFGFNVQGQRNLNSINPTMQRMSFLHIRMRHM